MLDADARLARTRETSIGMALLDGQIEATVNRTVDGNGVRFALTPYRPLAAAERQRLQRAADAYGAFLGVRATLTVVS